MVSLSPSTDVTVPEIDRPAAPRPPKKPPPFPPGTKLPVGPLPPPTKPPLKLPRPPVGAAAGEGATPGVAGAAGCGAGVTGCEVVGSSAMSMLSLLFVAQGADGVEAGGLA